MKYTYLIVIFLFVISGCKPTEELVKKRETKQDLINFVFRNYISERPSASFAVIKDGKIEDCQSFGYADLENKIQANCETNYRLASVTKQFTAMGILKLINQGELNFDTKLTQVIPEFPDYGKEITIKNLLTHRSGLQDYSKLYPKDSEKPLVDKEVLDLLIAQDSLLFPANTQFKYSNSGYAVLAMIIERVSGKTFKRFMKEEIFEKTGMTNSTIYVKGAPIKNRAFGYTFNDSLNKYINIDQNIWSAIQGDGGVYSSVSDYAKWDNSLYDETLVSSDLLNDAFSSWDENGKTEGNGYGFGWFIEMENGKKHLRHSGSTTGFINISLRIPSEKLSVVIFTNTSDFGGLRRTASFLASLYSDGQLPIPIDVMIEKEITNNGSGEIKTYYDTLILSKDNYKVDTEDLTRLGFSYLRKDEKEDAFNVFTFVKMEFPQNFDGYIGLAHYYKKYGNNEKAIEYFKKVIEVATSDEQRHIDFSKKMIKELSE
ncbi:serine hydrolase [Formosa algae]|uniref:CubicO group peptidase (Beta-lactamase class C family) n=1 Tax=Formosa algae TaxID=225843 RepID=A0A9X0YPB2_9FLAO|nr:serine hydrolase [Formosa algae]MBP1841573.1 CubicO group peptidase (beta-lactamase class C family) [Formosa algae]MDQ0337034.1 CubicO group peptidase (beta-lactamase class C family) [Formosa algae]OEI80198.1 hypothetical protein AST99_10445 [Formosa algae]